MRVVGRKCLIVLQVILSVILMVQVTTPFSYTLEFFTRDRATLLSKQGTSIITHL